MLINDDQHPILFPRCVRLSIHKISSGFGGQVSQVLLFGLETGRFEGIFTEYWICYSGAG